MQEITRESVIQSMEAAAERMGLDLEDLQEMVGEVLEDCSEKLNTLKNAIGSGDTSAVKAIAHDIKGSSANYGLSAASEIAFQIEKNYESASIDAVNELIEMFKTFGTLELDKTN